MLKPDYKWNSILNLMSSIINKYWWHSDYNELVVFPSNKLINNKTILFLIDWFWYNSLNYLPGDLLNNFYIEKITSVYPTSTTSAITTINTWEPPLKHWLISWFQYMKNLWTIWIPLSNHTRYYDKINISDKWFNKKYFINLDTIYFKINCKSTVITKNSFINTDFTLESTKWVSKILSYSEISDISDLLFSELFWESEYIYLYIDTYDTYSHDFWYNSEKSLDILSEIINELNIFISKSEWYKYNLLVTWDHWQIISKNKVILSDFKELNNFLSIIPTWDSRHMNIFLKNWTKEKFLKYFNTHLSKYFSIYSYDDVINNNLYWVWEINENFRDYFWDYLLIAKDNYIIWNFLFNEIEEYNIWEHWWLSEEEIYVPLLVNNCGIY